MTHEDIVQESKKYWQQMEAHASKPANSVVSKGHLRLGARFCSQWFQLFLSFPPTTVPDRSQADQAGHWGELRAFPDAVLVLSIVFLQCYFLLCSLVRWSLQVTESNIHKNGVSCDTLLVKVGDFGAVATQWPNVSCFPLVAEGW